MSDHYDHEYILEEPGDFEEHRGYGVKGILVGMALGGFVLFGLVVGGRAAAGWIGGLAGFSGVPDETGEVLSGQAVILDVPSGASARQIGSLLVSSGVIASGSEFEAAVREREASSHLKAGGYELVAGSSLSSIVDILVTGPNVTTFRVTLVEGRRIGEAIADLARQSEFSEADFTSALLNGSVQSIYLPENIEGVQAWEGLLFPDTYEFFTDATPPEMLQRLANEMERRVSQLDWQPLRAKDFSIYQGIVMASIVEAEAGVDEDRPLIASVLFNRLDQGTLLQIDATVLYAMGERGTGLTLDDLEFDSPYNTYVTIGLPPTPIGAPGFSSLDAVSAPEESDFIYYVLTSSDGTHTFTVTYDDFLVAKDQAKADGIIP